MKKIKKLTLKFKIFIFCLIILALGKALYHGPSKPTKKIMVFVHGTLMPGLAILNPIKTYNQTIESSDWYCRSLAKLRNNPSLYEDSIILEEGLKKIDPSILNQYKYQTLIPSYSKKGAYQAIGAYDFLQKSINKEIDIDYYTFGFQGILSDNHRKESAHQLYDSLIDLINKNKKNGFNTEINFCGYSHGGNVILYLVDAEIKNRKNLKIKDVILFGTPIQSETAFYASYPIFERIINFYSEADTVQGSDSVSIGSNKCFNTFTELCSSKKLPLYNSNIIDIRLLAQRNPNVFGHFSYWFFEQNTTPWLEENQEKIQEVLNYINPMPLAVLTPIFLKIIENIKINNFDISLEIKNSIFKIKAIEKNENKILAESEDLTEILDTIQTYAQRSWKPYSESSETNRLTMGLMAALECLRS